MNESLKKIKVMDKNGTGKEVEITRYVIDPKERPTAVILGKFFPFTGAGGHGRLIKLAEEKFGHGNYVIASPARKTTNKEVDIFTSEQRRAIIEKAVPGVKYYELEGGIPAYMFRELVEKGIKRPVIICGPDRLQEYKKFFIEYDRNNKAIEDVADKDFGKGEYLYSEDRGLEDTSGTKVRGYLLNGEKDEFLKATKYKVAMWDFMRDMLKKNHLIKESFRSFNEFYRLDEGGNVTVKGIPASVIRVNDMDEGQFDKLRSLIKDALFDLNDKFKKSTGEYLWPDLKKVVSSGELFSGSTKHMFSKDYKTFVKYKKNVGDIDIQIPKEKDDDFLDFLKKNEGKKFADLVYVGNGGRSKIQINTIFQAPKEYERLAKYMQVDFEPTDWEKGVPTPYSGFGHHSSWKDITENIKGLWRNNIWRALISRQRHGDIVVLTKTGKISSRPELVNPSKNALALDKGLRTKFAPVLDDKGNIKLTNGKPTYKETSKEADNYDTRLENIFALGLGHEPTKKEIEDMHSFVSVLDMMKKYLTKEEIEATTSEFYDIVFGSRAQVGQKGPMVDGINTSDADVKIAALNKYWQVFPYTKISDKELKDKLRAVYARKGTQDHD